MTNGTVVVLGTVGRNFGAGMTGGKAYVLDFLGDFPRRCNTEFVRFDRLDGIEENRVLQSIIYQYVEATSSERAQKILLNWGEYQSMFWKIAPKAQSVTVSAEEARMETSVEVRS
jgi:glutamate synthase domain-containing protein 3